MAPNKISDHKESFIITVCLNKQRIIDIMLISIISVRRNSFRNWSASTHRCMLRCWLWWLHKDWSGNRKFGFYRNQKSVEISEIHSFFYKNQEMSAEARMFLILVHIFSNPHPTPTPKYMLKMLHLAYSNFKFFIVFENA